MAFKKWPLKEIAKVYIEIPWLSYKKNVIVNCYPLIWMLQGLFCSDDMNWEVSVIWLELLLKIYNPVCFSAAVQFQKQREPDFWTLNPGSNPDENDWC